jgi:hypothetical protein
VENHRNHRALRSDISRTRPSHVQLSFGCCEQWQLTILSPSNHDCIGFQWLISLGLCLVEPDKTGTRSLQRNHDRYTKCLSNISITTVMCDPGPNVSQSSSPLNLKGFRCGLVEITALGNRGAAGTLSALNASSDSSSVGRSCLADHEHV